MVLCHAGVAHGAYDNDIEALLGIRDLINYFPLSNREPAPLRKCDDPWYVFTWFHHFLICAGLDITTVCELGSIVCNNRL